MSEKIFVYAHPDDEANSLTAIKRSAETNDPAHLLCISNGDSNVKQNSGVREQETADVLAAFLGQSREKVDRLIDFCGFSEREFREALLSGHIEQVLEETLDIRNSIAQLTEGANAQIFTNFPDGGDVRHLYTTWVITNVVFPYLQSKGINVEIFGNPKQIFDETGDILEIGRLPEGWKDRLPFAEPADVPEISLEDGVITLSQDERKLIEPLFRYPEIYKSQRGTPQNLALMHFYMGRGHHREEHFYKLDPSKLDYKKLREQLPVMGMETFGRSRVKANAHNHLITYDHFLRLIKELESHI